MNVLKGELSKKPRHLIQVVGRRTGISSDVIRAWERRYNAVVSNRTETNRRLYTDDDIEKLTLLKRAINAGRRIGDIAQLSYDDLFELVMGDESNATRSYQRPSTGTVMELFDEAALAIDEMNSNKLDTALSNAIAMLSTTDFLMEFLKPLHTYINDECSRGSLRYIQEKFAKVSMRNCLSNLYTKFRSAKDQGPRMIIGSLTSEDESIDTLMHIIVAQNIGWDVTYVGNSVPHDEMTYMANKISNLHALSCIGAGSTSKRQADPLLLLALARAGPWHILTASLWNYAACMPLGRRKRKNWKKIR